MINFTFIPQSWFRGNQSSTCFRNLEIPSQKRYTSTKIVSFHSYHHIASKFLSILLISLHQLSLSNRIWFLTASLCLQFITPFALTLSFYFHCFSHALHWDFHFFTFSHPMHSHFHLIFTILHTHIMLICMRCAAFLLEYRNPRAASSWSHSGATRTCTHWCHLRRANTRSLSMRCLAKCASSISTAS